VWCPAQPQARRNTGTPRSSHHSPSGNGAMPLHDGQTSQTTRRNAPSPRSRREHRPANPPSFRGPPQAEPAQPPPTYLEALLLPTHQPTPTRQTQATARLALGDQSSDLWSALVNNMIVLLQILQLNQPPSVAQHNQPQRSPTLQPPSQSERRLQHNAGTDHASAQPRGRRAAPAKLAPRGGPSPTQAHPIGTKAANDITRRQQSPQRQPSSQFTGAQPPAPQHSRRRPRNTHGSQSASQPTAQPQPAEHLA